VVEEVLGMGIGTLFRYLVGERKAILEIAGNPRALWVGLLFVLSAGLAREYDGEDLLHEPWHLALPLVASLASSFVLFTVAYGVAVLKGEAVRPFFRRYAAFLGLFWMTAPLAWLYAIPYERFLGTVDATQANLATLALVAAWRVLLMIRVLQVGLGYSAAGAAALVMLFADGVVLAVVDFLPVPGLLGLMGGVHVPDSERVLSAVATYAMLLGVCSFPLWVIAAVVLAVVSKPAWRVPPTTTGEPAGDEPAPRLTRPLRILASLSVVGWLLVLPFTQAEQALRYRVERAFREGRLEDALTLMSAHRRADFPPHWDPPPRRFFHARLDPPPLPAVLRIVAASETAPWVRDVYLGKLAIQLRLSRTALFPGGAAHVVRLLKRIPGGLALIDELERNGHRDAAVELRDALRNLGGADTRPVEQPD
jgi:hypothetical protein